MSGRGFSHGSHCLWLVRKLQKLLRKDSISFDDCVNVGPIIRVLRKGKNDQWAI